MVAFGDTTNDNDMLQYSGLGVCMSNGSDDTKAIADDITKCSNDEDGFAQYMEEKFSEYIKEHLRNQCRLELFTCFHALTQNHRKNGTPLSPQHTPVSCNVLQADFSFSTRLMLQRFMTNKADK